MKISLMFTALLLISIGTASADTLSSTGLSGKAYYKDLYLIESSNMPNLFYNDIGSVARYEVLRISPSKTVYSDKYAK